MFSKTRKDSAKKAGTQAAEKASPPSIISTDMRIVGDLSSEGEIQIDGAIDGDIRSKTLLVGETAIIKGEIAADSVNVHGTLNGQIKARSVNLFRSSHVVGDIIHEDLAIETGAFLEGHCKRMTESKSPVDAAADPATTPKPAQGTPVKR